MVWRFDACCERMSLTVWIRCVRTGKKREAGKGEEKEKAVAYDLREVHAMKRKKESVYVMKVQRILQSQIFSHSFSFEEEKKKKRREKAREGGWSKMCASMCVYVWQKDMEFLVLTFLFSQKSQRIHSRGFLFPFSSYCRSSLCACVQLLWSGGVISRAIKMMPAMWTASNVSFAIFFPWKKRQQKK